MKIELSVHAVNLANVAGFVAAFYVHGALSIFGISLILVRSAEAFFVVKMLGAGHRYWVSPWL